MDVRPITADEVETFYGAFNRSMGFPPPSERDVERARRTTRFERTLAAFDRGQVVGTAHSHLFELTLPGALTIPAAGVTAVSVATTHRRRGVLTELMRRQLWEARERSEPVAILIASEGIIYGRFGYGLSSTLIDVEIDTRDKAFARETGTSGRVSFVDGPEADKVFPGVYDRWRRNQPGTINRDETWWERWRDERKPGEELLVVWEDESGSVEGYARYSVRMKWEAGLPQYTLDVAELTATTIEGSAALWRYCLNADLVRRMTAGTRSVEDPLRWMLANPRAMRVTRVGDFLWTRLLDVPGALAGRRYGADTELVVAVTDDVFEENGGRYALSASLRDAACERTERDADLALPVAELGAIYLGGVAPSELAAVGRIRELRSGALARADAAFTSRPRPWGNTWF